jgi:5'-3' exonuclease
MGIKDLMTFVKKQHPEVFKTSFTTWQNKFQTTSIQPFKVAIDVPILAYKLAYVSGTDALVPRILSFASTFQNTTGTPIFVFDGQSLLEKTEEKAKRFLAFQKRPQVPLHETRKLFSDENEIIIELGPPPCTQPNKKDYERMKEALVSSGYTCQTAKFEAEALCAFLCHSGKVDAVLTEDSDAFAYLSPKVILKYGSPDCVLVESKNIIQALNLENERFIDFCVLLGNDFNERIPLVGPVKSLALLKKHSTLNEVLRVLEISDERKTRMNRSVEIFKTFCFELEEN